MLLYTRGWHKATCTKQRKGVYNPWWR